MIGMISRIKNIFKVVNINLIDKELNPITSGRNKIKVIPREGELIYIGIHQQYYRVVNIIYVLDKTKNIFIVIEKFGNKTPESTDNDIIKK